MTTRSRYRIWDPKTVRSGAVCGTALACVSVLALMLGAQSRPAPPMRQQARAALQGPVKVDIIPGAATKAGESLPAKLVLQDGKGQPVAAEGDISFEVTAVQPSGNVLKSTVRFADGESAKPVSFHADEPGVVKLSVRQTEDRLIGSTNYALVLPAKKKKTKATPSKTNKSVKPPRQDPPRPDGLTMQPPGRDTPRLVMAAFRFQQSGSGTQSGQGNVDSAPQLMLKVSGENDAEGIRADGQAFARVQVFYLGSDPPASGIRIWLQWTNGEMDSNPLEIRRGQPVAEAHWTSQYAISAAQVSIVAAHPAMQFYGPTEATVRFAEPILGIDFVNPPDRISIVDNVTLVAGFFDPRGYPIQTSMKRPFRFASNNPVLHLSPEHDEVAPGMSEFVTVALPTALGTSRIEVSTPGYRPAYHNIMVVGTAVILLCLIGGIAGGLLAYVNSQGKLWARILTGIIVGGVGSWAYVYVGLPNVTNVILHNQISVLFISTLAAFGGTKGIGFITKALNLGF